VGAYFFGIIPSLIYAIIMEIAYYAGLSFGSWKSFLFSGCLGLLAGASVFIHLREAFNSPNFASGYIIFGLLGAGAGIFSNLFSLLSSSPRQPPDNGTPKEA
jgi:hypothetical protein